MLKDADYYQKELEGLQQNISSNNHGLNNSVMFSLESMEKEVAEIVQGGQKGLELLKKVNRKPEPMVLENHEKFKRLLDNIRAAIEGFKR